MRQADQHTPSPGRQSTTASFFLIFKGKTSLCLTNFAEKNIGWRGDLTMCIQCLLPGTGLYLIHDLPNIFDFNVLTKLQSNDGDGSFKVW